MIFWVGRDGQQRCRIAIQAVLRCRGAMIAAACGAMPRLAPRSPHKAVFPLYFPMRCTSIVNPKAHRHNADALETEIDMHKILIRLTPLLLAGLACGVSPAAIGAEPATPPAPAAAAPVTETQGIVDMTLSIVRKMRQDPQVDAILQRAKGIYLLPAFARGGAGAAQPGEGVFLVRQDKGWSAPVFYNVSGISVPAGASAGGAVALVLMNVEPVARFETNKSFVLNPTGYYDILTYAAKNQVAAREGKDIIVWSDMKDAPAVSVDQAKLTLDDARNKEYYQTETPVSDILQGTVKNPAAQHLQNDLPV
jgi:lipid-binding SYLF domain-containing protein